MTSDIEKLVQRFVSGADNSIDMYSPEGGEFLLDTAAIRQRLIETLEYLQTAA